MTRPPLGVTSTSLLTLPSLLPLVFLLSLTIPSVLSQIPIQTFNYRLLSHAIIPHSNVVYTQTSNGTHLFNIGVSGNDLSPSIDFLSLSSLSSITPPPAWVRSFEWYSLIVDGCHLLTDFFVLLSLDVDFEGQLVLTVWNGVKGNTHVTVVRLSTNGSITACLSVVTESGVVWPKLIAVSPVSDLVVHVTSSTVSTYELSTMHPLSVVSFDSSILLVGAAVTFSDELVLSLQNCTDYPHCYQRLLWFVINSGKPLTEVRAVETPSAYTQMQPTRSGDLIVLSTTPTSLCLVQPQSLAPLCQSLHPTTLDWLLLRADHSLLSFGIEYQDGTNTTEVVIGEVLNPTSSSSSAPRALDTSPSSSSFSPLHQSSSSSTAVYRSSSTSSSAVVSRSSSSRPSTGTPPVDSLSSSSSSSSSGGSRVCEEEVQRLKEAVMTLEVVVGVLVVSIALLMLLH